MFQKQSNARVILKNGVEIMAPSYVKPGDKLEVSVESQEFRKRL